MQMPDRRKRRNEEGKEGKGEYNIGWLLLIASSIACHRPLATGLRPRVELAICYRVCLALKPPKTSLPWFDSFILPTLWYYFDGRFMRKYDYAHEPPLFNQSQVCFRETQGLVTLTCLAQQGHPLRKFCNHILKITSQDQFQITTVAGAIMMEVNGENL